MGPKMRRRHEPDPDVVGRRPTQFGKEAGIGRCMVYKLIADGELETAKIGRARIILTSPREFLSRHRVDGSEL